MNEDTEAIVDGIRIALERRGAGRPILFLHPAIGLWQAGPALDRLAAHGLVLAPSHPGFGTSERPDGLSTVDDLALFYRRFLVERDLRDAIVVGAGLGGWIAASLAVYGSERIGALVLVGAVGIRVGQRDDADLADIYALPRAEIDRLAFADPSLARRDAPSETEAAAIARNREAAALLGWSPYMHDPRLKRRLSHVAVPSLVLWGAADGIAPPAYGEAYAAAIPGARFERIEGAGHFPHIEQPAKLAERIAAFAGLVQAGDTMRRRA